MVKINWAAHGLLPLLLGPRRCPFFFFFSPCSCSSCYTSICVFSLWFVSFSLLPLMDCFFVFCRPTCYLCMKGSIKCHGLVPMSARGTGHRVVVVVWSLVFMAGWSCFVLSDKRSQLHGRWHARGTCCGSGGGLCVGKYVSTYVFSFFDDSYGRDLVYLAR